MTLWRALGVPASRHTKEATSRLLRGTLEHVFNSPVSSPSCVPRLSEALGASTSSLAKSMVPLRPCLGNAASQGRTLFLPSLTKSRGFSPATAQAVTLSKSVAAGAVGAGVTSTAAQGASVVTSGVGGQVEGVLALLKHHGSNYYQLSKSKLSLLVAATSAAGFVAGSGETVEWGQCAWACLGTFLAGACANTLNQVYEVTNDGAMKRTMRRPLPTGRISKAHALAWALVSGVGGVAALLHSTNMGTATSYQEADTEGHSPVGKKLGSVVPAALAVGNIVLYAGVYTPLKQMSILNTWVGAVVGAIPPLIGWTAATGEGLSDLKESAGAWVWGAVLFLWQLPHFFALAWLCKDDYARGGYKMLSLVDSTGRRTSNAAIRNAAMLIPLGPLSTALGLTTVPFAIEASLLSAGLTAAAVPFHRAPNPATARKLFRASLLYLPAYMGCMALHRVPHGQEQPVTLDLDMFKSASQRAALGLPGQDVADKARDSEMLESAQREKRGREKRMFNSSAERDGDAHRRAHTLPPAAYASAAPFPFLPLPY